MKILDGPASATGSARGIAERITAGLDSAGHDVGLQSCADIAEVNDYEVVPGSAIHNRQWLPAAADMIDRLRSHLEAKVVWAFSVPSAGTRSTILSPRVANELRRVIPEPRVVQRLRAPADVRDHRLFAGATAYGTCHYRDTGGRPDTDRWTGAVRAEAPRGERR
ncbi:hypothetical protein WSS_A38717 [Rhodococcus opacus M213]|uniref:Flavodoxin domain-containing protein n=1 Tax=Rhodococcus opacus M213 TaxID=1129896 RepID=K8X6V7_RHOOP|nr:flavodoxin domain-containing protein [Rhodococcus opacus]EKT77198.1 hypothetical protein WSS_A38717 [Rhodococcus opacus M213]